MATELVAQISPRDFEHLDGPLRQTNVMQVADTVGLRVLKSDLQGYTAPLVLPAGWTYTTGITVKFLVVDDGTDSADVSKAVVFGVTVKKIVGGTDTFAISTGAGTEQTATVTLDETAGTAVVGTITLANAVLDSAGAGDPILLRFRRIGNNASDTCANPVIVPLVYVHNT